MADGLAHALVPKQATPIIPAAVADLTARKDLFLLVSKESTKARDMEALSTNSQWVYESSILACKRKDAKDGKFYAESASSLDRGDVPCSFV